MAESAPSGDKTFVQKAWAVQHKVDRAIENVKGGRFARVLRMARKPEPEEFRQSATIVLVSIAVIGAIGFFIYLFMTWLLRAVA